MLENELNNILYCVKCVNNVNKDLFELQHLLDDYGISETEIEDNTLMFIHLKGMTLVLEQPNKEALIKLLRVKESKC